ncbi:MAG: hypothetical protein K9M55_12185 [Candidatus Marinimicrobia bacterium]|nr:hypothetical protein [Candidatus Neomarinimicrobiota bacterium]
MILLERLHSQSRGQLFWILFGFTLLTIIAMQITGAPLKTAVAPGGIVSFELVGTLVGSHRIIDSWQGPVMTWAGINLGLDFLFLFLYGITIALGCLILADKMPDKYKGLKIVGKWLAVGILVAAGLDFVENISLIALLTGSENQFLPVLARWCAIPKFGLILLSLLYVLSGVLIIIINSVSTNMAKKDF